MLYLVKGTIAVTPYMCDRVTYEETRLVEAETSDQARLKFDTYWESKTDAYSIYYHVTSCEVLETIR